MYYFCILTKSSNHLVSNVCPYVSKLGSTKEANPYIPVYVRQQLCDIQDGGGGIRIRLDVLVGVLSQVRFPSGQTKNGHRYTGTCDVVICLAIEDGRYTAPFQTLTNTDILF